MRLVVRLIKLELALYLALGRWIVRRPQVPAGTTPWGYSRDVTPVMGLWIFASALEVPLVHVLVPWDSVRLVLLGVSVWGLVWMLGMLASIRIYPHLADEDGVRIRYGRFADLRVPWDRVAGVTRVDRDLPSSIRTHQPLETDAGTDLQIGVSARANVHLALVGPTEVTTPKGPMTVVAVTFLVDDPVAFVAAARVASRLA